MKMKKQHSKQEAIYEGIQNLMLDYETKYKIVPLDKTFLKINNLTGLLTREEPPSEKEVGEIIGIPSWDVTPVCSVCYSQTFDMIVIEGEEYDTHICRDCLIKGISILDNKKE
jgi:hypothetical protein